MRLKSNVQSNLDMHVLRNLRTFFKNCRTKSLFKRHDFLEAPSLLRFVSDGHIRRAGLLGPLSRWITLRLFG